ncbi:DUF5615 family PIN-like protein [Citromicrobium bathyomarinum]
MKIRADEHVAPAIVDAIANLAITRDFEISSVLRAGFKGASDVHWITAFAADGGEAILTADTDFFKQPPQVQAVERTGVRVIHLPSGWANSNRATQAGYLLVWWSRIERQLTEMKPRECYAIPFTHSEKGTLKKIALNFQEANKKAKKAARRNRQQM